MIQILSQLLVYLKIGIYNIEWFPIRVRYRALRIKFQNKNKNGEDRVNRIKAS